MTDELKILDDKIKANPAQYDLGREVAEISALSSKDLLKKDEYSTSEDLGHRSSVLVKTNLRILHSVCHLVNHLTKIMLKILRIKRVILIMTITEKNVDKKGFIKYFSYKPITLVNKSLGQNMQDLRKGLDEIKQQTIEFKKDERNSTNIKDENDRLNNILSVIDRIYQFF